MPRVADCRCFVVAFLCFASGVVPQALPAQGATPAVPEEISDALVGLVVHLHCGDGRLTTALGAAGGRVVQGLDTDPDLVAAARDYVHQKGVYGRVSIDQFDGRSLPYASNSVNTVVARDLRRVPTDEVMRVLAPGGVLCTCRESGTGTQPDRWTTTVKPRRGDTDEWTHFLHDASGNAVAHDDVVAPPARLQWSADPAYTRSHEHIPSLYALVSTGGRIFYIEDAAPVASIRETPRWRLVARDAYNGTLLWARTVSEWYPHIINWGFTPTQLERKLVAQGDRVFASLGLWAPVSVIDAASGDVRQVFEATRGAEEIILAEDVVLVVVRDVTDARTAEFRRMQPLLEGPESPLYERDTAEPLIQRYRTADRQAGVKIVAVDASTGETLWDTGEEDLGRLQKNSLCAVGDRVLYQNGSEIACVDRQTGQTLWSRPAPTMKVAYGDAVYCFGGGRVVALAIDDGRLLWEQEPLLTHARDAFVAAGSLWIGGFKPFERPNSKYGGPSWGPYFVTQRDPATGEVLMHIEPDNPGHHHRCYQNKATDRYILGGRRGTEFIDLETGEVLWNSWARGVCKYGVMPANGLLYVPPHACGCYMTTKLVGFNALAGRADDTEADERLRPQVDRGAAYDDGFFPNSPQDWPTLRCDMGRSGQASCDVPARLRSLWRVDLGGKPSAPTVSQGRLFVAMADEHAVCAIDADSGASEWRFTTGARVDSPPTIHQGRALFGSRDGCVYSLAAEDGRLAWRLRTGRQPRRVVVREQLESVAPAVGSVLVRDDIVYCTAGRNSYMDGGIDLFRVDAASGDVLSRTPIYSPDEEGRQPEQYGPNSMPGEREDVLSADAKHVYLRDMAFDRQGQPTDQTAPHLFALTSFLDDAWAHRAYWVFGTECSISTGCSGQKRGLIYGRLMVFDDETIYGHGRASVHWSNALQDGDYRLFARRREGGEPVWEQRVPIQVRAMVLAGDYLFAAGPVAPPHSRQWDLENEQQAILLVLSTRDGSEQARYPLDASPVFDGMAAAGERLYLTLENGSAMCFAE